MKQSSTSPLVNRPDSRFVRWCLCAPLPLLALFSALVVSSGVHADETWEFRLSPYAWLVNMKGELATGSDAPTAPIDVSASDVIGDIDSALMLIFNAKKGRHGVFVDIFYADLVSESEFIPEPINLNGRIRAESKIFTAAYQNEVFEDEGISIDLLAGARYWSVKSVLSFSGGAGFLEGRRFTSSDSWTDPVVGAKGHMPLGQSRFYLAGALSFGGFGVGSDSYYEISTVLGYRWSEAISTAVGYRYLDVDYSDNDFLYDVKQEGLQLGLTWSF